MRTLRVVVVLSLVASSFRLAQAGDWPQLQHDPQRSGFTPEEVAPPLKMAWTHNFHPQRVSRHVQPVVSDGRVFVPTEAGELFAFAVADGKVLWKSPLGAPVEHSAACAGGKVFAAALDGKVHALDAVTGQSVWVFTAPVRRASFSQSPLIADNKLFIASRQGVLYALDLGKGAILWQQDLGVPVYNTAAFNAGRVYVGGEDIRIRCFDAASGKLVWISDPLYGQTLKEYHPVITGGFVLVRPMPAHPSREYFNSNYGKDPAQRADYIFQATWGHYYEWSGFPARRGEAASPQDVQSKLTPLYQKLAPEVKAGRLPKEVTDGEEAMIEHYRKNPYDQDLFVLNESDAKQAYIAPQMHCLSLPGPDCPPAVAADGTVVMPWVFMTHTWAKLDLKRGRLADIMVMPRPNNGDETVNVSCGGRYVYLFHTNELGPNGAFSGIFDCQSRTWWALIDVKGRFTQMTDNCQSGNAAAAIADRHVFHIVAHQLGAYVHDDAPKAAGGNNP